MKLPASMHHHPKPPSKPSEAMTYLKSTLAPVVLATSISAILVTNNNLLTPATITHPSHNTPQFIKTREGPLIQTSTIRWILPTHTQKHNKCFLICNKSNGCVLNANITYDKWSVCEKETPDSYKTISKSMKASEN